MKHRISWTLFLVLALTASSVFAQETSQADQRGFSVQNFQTAPGYGSFLTVEGSRVDTSEKFRLRVGGLFNYQYKPLVVQTCNATSGGNCTDWGNDEMALVKHHLTLELMGAVSMFGIFEAGLVIPTVLYQNGDDVTQGDVTTIEAPAGKVGISDLRLHLKLDILHGLLGHQEDAISLAFVTVLTFPVGNAAQGDTFMGDSSVTVHPKLVAGSILGRFRLGASLGYNWRQTKEFHLTEVGPRLSYAAAGEYLIDDHWSAILEFFGENGFTSGVTGAPLEGDAAARYKFGNGWELTAGFGLGIMAGVGTPRVRAFGGAAYRPELTLDKDGDGLKNKEDQCPANPEDHDGFEDADGCPDPDNDADGILDGQDDCPIEAEDADGFEDKNGCPDPDNDGDGILDRQDSCPIEAEDADGFEDENGCPDPDNDADGILDEQDSCPIEAEDADGFEDENGCPDLDNDGDGFPDVKDDCPDAREVLNGFEDDDGCPDKGRELVVVTAEKFELLQQIRFATASDRIIGKKSFEILDAVVAVLAARTAAAIRIEGHTDSVGKAQYNRDLSQRRADAVMKYVADGGIATARLEAIGYGPDKPIDTNDTPEGRAANRRVEFVITSQ